MQNHLNSADVTAVVGAIDPDVTTASTVESAWISAAEFFTYQAIVLCGTLGTNATVDAKIEQATDSSGTGAKDLSGSDITQITQAGTDQSDTQACISLF